MYEVTKYKMAEVTTMGQKGTVYKRRENWRSYL